MPSAPCASAMPLTSSVMLAARRGEVDDLARWIGFRVDGQRHDAERLVAVVHGATCVVDHAVLHALAERDAAHQAALERAALREELPLEHLAGIRHAERIDAARDRAGVAAQSRQLVVGDDRRAGQARELAVVDRVADERRTHRVIREHERPPGTADLEAVSHHTCEASMSETRCFRVPSRPYTSRPPVPPAPRTRLRAPSSGWTQIATPLAPSWAVGAVSPAEATVATTGSASGAGAFLRTGREGRGQGDQPGTVGHRHSLAVWTK